MPSGIHAVVVDGRRREPEEQPQPRSSALQLKPFGGGGYSPYGYNPYGYGSFNPTEASEVSARQAVLANSISHENI